MKLWKVSTGQCLFSWEFPTAVKRVAWSEDDSKVVLVTEQRMGHQGAIRVFEINRTGGTRASRSISSPASLSEKLMDDGDAATESEEPETLINPVGSKAQVVSFADLDRCILSGHESGKVALWDAKSGEEIESREKNHVGLVTDLQLSADRTYFVTSSKDKSARVRPT